MNNLVKELFEQSKAADWSHDAPSYDYEKFVELIVEECNNRANQYIRDCGEVSCLPDRILEEHFGLK